MCTNFRWLLFAKQKSGKLICVLPPLQNMDTLKHFQHNLPWTHNLNSFQIDIKDSQNNLNILPK